MLNHLLIGLMADLALGQSLCKANQIAIIGPLSGSVRLRLVTKCYNRTNNYHSNATRPQKPPRLTPLLERARLPIDVLERAETATVRPNWVNFKQR